MIRCIVFDFDGTLVDSNAIKRETFFTIARSWDSSDEVVMEVFERWPAADRYEKTYKIAEGLISRNLRPKGSSVEKLALKLANDYTTQCESAIASCAEMGDATQTLNELNEKDYLLFVNSATPVGPLRKILTLRNWTHFFQWVYGSEDSKADNLKHIASRAGAKPKEVVHVGDQYDDLQATEQFGCHFVAMADCDNRPVAKSSALVVQRLSELPGLLTKLNQEAS